jgi:hypothetical protein
MFDQAGLQHVRSLLTGVPSAQPWRMGAADCLSSLADMVADNRIRLETKTLPATPWDPNLRPLMVEHGLAAYEEGHIKDLLTNLTDESIVMRHQYRIERYLSLPGLGPCSAPGSSASSGDVRTATPTAKRAATTPRNAVQVICGVAGQRLAGRSMTRKRPNGPGAVPR